MSLRKTTTHMRGLIANNRRLRCGTFGSRSEFEMHFIVLLEHVLHTPHIHNSALEIATDADQRTSAFYYFLYRMCKSSVNPTIRVI